MSGSPSNVIQGRNAETSMRIPPMMANTPPANMASCWTWGILDWGLEGEGATGAFLSLFLGGRFCFPALASSLENRLI